MPIALLLQETTAAFRFGARGLKPWSYLVRLEELLIDRARGAFLVHWFGEGVPLHGSQVCVVITNLDALRNRYLQVKRQFEADERLARGPNLTEPLSGLAGMLAGILFTPAVAIGSSIAVVRKVTLAWWKAVLLVLGGVIAPIVGALSPIFPAAGFASELAVGLSGDRGVRALFDFLGDTAQLLLAARKFLDLFLGPREGVHNILLKGILVFADQLSKLFPFGLALIATVVTRFGPLLLPLVAQLGAFQALVLAAFDTIGFIVGDLVDKLKDTFTGPNNLVSALKQVLAILKRPFKPAIARFKSFFEDAKKVVTRFSGDVKRQLESYSGVVPIQLKNAIDMVPGIVKIRRISAFFDLVGKRFESATAGPGSPSSGKPSPLDAWIEESKSFATSAEEAFGSFPKIPDVEMPNAMVKRLGLVEAYGIPSDIQGYKEIIKGNLPPVSEEVQKYVARARHPASTFAFERKALSIELGQSPRDALAEARAKELELRSLIEVVVGRILPPGLRALAPTLAKAFRGLDDTFTFDKKQPEAKDERKKEEPFVPPVKELPGDNGQLAPVIARFVVRAESGNRSDLYDFMVRLKNRLDQPYPVLT